MFLLSERFAEATKRIYKITRILKKLFTNFKNHLKFVVDYFTNKISRLYPKGMSVTRCRQARCPESNENTASYSM